MATLATARREDDDELDDEFEAGEYVKNENAGDMEKEVKRRVQILHEDMEDTSSEEQNKED